MSAQYFQFSLASYSSDVGPDVEMMPSYGFGFFPAFFSSRPKSRTLFDVGDQHHVGHLGADLLDELLRRGLVAGEEDAR